ncbi:hypothetical protein ACFYYN_43325 [Streptomyces sp. NPDC001902]
MGVVALGLLGGPALSGCASEGNPDNANGGHGPILRKLWDVPTGYVGDYDYVHAVWVMDDRIVRVSNMSLEAIRLSDGHSMYFRQLDYPPSASRALDSQDRGLVDGSTYDARTGTDLNPMGGGDGQKFVAREPGVTRQPIQEWRKKGHKYNSFTVQDPATGKIVGRYSVPELNFIAKGKVDKCFGIRLKDGRIVLVASDNVGDYLAAAYRAPE